MQKTETINRCSFEGLRERGVKRRSDGQPFGFARYRRQVDADITCQPKAPDRPCRRNGARHRERSRVTRAINIDQRHCRGQGQAQLATGEVTDQAARGLKAFCPPGLFEQIRIMRSDNPVWPDPRREIGPRTDRRIGHAPLGTLQRTGLRNHFACDFNADRRAFADFE